MFMLTDHEAYLGLIRIKPGARTWTLCVSMGVINPTPERAVQVLSVYSYLTPIPIPVPVPLPRSTPPLPLPNLQPLFDSWAKP